MSKKKPAYVDGKFVGDTLSISVKPHYQKEYEFLKSHHNRSGLICELIRQYLEGTELSIGFQKPTQEVTQHTQRPENRAEETKGGSEEVKSTSEGRKENKSKESESKNSQQKEENKIPVMAMPSFLNN